MKLSTRQRIALGIANLAVVTTGAVTALAAPSTPAANQPKQAPYSFVSIKHGNLRNDYVTGAEVDHGGEVHGMALTQANKPFESDLSALPELRQDGVNTVDLLITEYEAGKHGDKVFNGGATPTTQQVASAIQKARADGMAVELMPIVWKTKHFIFRTEWDPRKIHQWRMSYTHMIVKWAKVAQQNGVSLFSVGSELSSTIQHVHAWRQIIKAVRRHYHGTLTYMADLTTIFKVAFWKQLDEIGVSPYYTLSDAKVPSIKSMEKAWHKDYLPALAALASREHRKMIFDELGYTSEIQAAYRPFAVRNEPPSEKAQANAYQAAINVTHGLSWLRGLILFTWGPTTAAPVDRGYEPGNKLAECVMAKSWAPSSGPKLLGQPPACTRAEAALRQSKHGNAQLTKHPAGTHAAGQHSAATHAAGQHSGGQPR